MEIARNSIMSICLVACLMLFLVAPVVLVFPLSFSNDTFLTFPPTHWACTTISSCSIAVL